MSDFEPIDEALPAGAWGSWLLTQPTVAFDSTKIAFGIRFLPKVSKASDPMAYRGNVQVADYWSGRPRINSAAETEALFASEHFRLMQTNNFSVNNRWNTEQVVLSCWNEETCDPVVEPPTEPGPTGAISTFASVAVSVAAVATMVNF